MVGLECKVLREKIGEIPTEMFFHFFKSFSDNARCNLNVRAEGENEHHKIEAIFKAFGKAVKLAVKQSDNLTSPQRKVFYDSNIEIQCWKYKIGTECTYTTGL